MTTQNIRWTLQMHHLGRMIQSINPSDHGRLRLKWAPVRRGVSGFCRGSAVAATAAAAPATALIAAGEGKGARS